MAGSALRILELSTEETVQRHFIDHLARHLRSLGHTVWQVNGADCSIRRTLSLWDVVAVGRVWWRLVRWKIDVLHVQTAKAGGVGRLAAWLAGTRRVIYTAHDFPFHAKLPRWRRRLYVRLERWLAPWCQAITVDSAAVRNAALIYQVAPMRKLHVIPVGVDTTHFTPRPKPDGPPFVIGTVARLVPDKGVAMLLYLLWELRVLGWEVRGLLVGDGPQRDLLARLAQALDLTDRVQWMGYQQDVRPFLAQMDVFVLPTRHEGLSVAVMEAMSMAVPVVVSDLPAFHDLVVEGQTGRVVRGTDWATTVGHLLQHPDQRQALGHAARAHVQRYYEQAACTQATARLVVGG